MAWYLGMSEIAQWKRARGICGQRAGEDSQKYQVKAIYQVVLLHKEFHLFCM